MTKYTTDNRKWLRSQLKLKYRTIMNDKQNVINNILSALSKFNKKKCKVIIELPNINDRLHYILNEEGRIVNVDSVPTLQRYEDLSIASLEDCLRYIIEYGTEIK